MRIEKLLKYYAIDDDDQIQIEELTKKQALTFITLTFTYLSYAVARIKLIENKVNEDTSEELRVIHAIHVFLLRREKINLTISQIITLKDSKYLLEFVDSYNFYVDQKEVEYSQFVVILDLMINIHASSLRSIFSRKKLKRFDKHDPQLFFKSAKYAQRNEFIRYVNKLGM